MKNFLKLLLLTTLVIFFGCAKEEFENSINEEHIKSSIKCVSLKDLQPAVSSKISSQVAELKKGAKMSTQGKLEFDSSLGIYVDTDSGKEIQTENKISYTFSAYKETEEKLLNVLFELKEDGSIETYIIKYQLTPDEIKNLSVEQQSELLPQFEKINYGSGTVFSFDCIEVVATTTVYPNCPYPNGLHPNGATCSPEVSIKTYTFCNWNSDGGGGGDASGTTAGTGGSNTSGGTSSGTSQGSGGATNGGIPTTPVVTYTNAEIQLISAINEFAEDAMFNLLPSVTSGILAYANTISSTAQLNSTANFFNNNTDVVTWLSEQPESTQTSVVNYLIDNNFSQESQNNINSLVNISITNDATFTFDSSINSSNAQIANSEEELNNILASVTNFISEDNTSEVIGNTKIARFSHTMNFFTHINAEVTQNLNPYSVQSVSSNISGNTFSLSYQQSTDSGAAQVTTSGNTTTVEFYGTLSVNVFFEGIGTIHTYYLHFVCVLNNTTGNPISMQVYTVHP